MASNVLSISRFASIVDAFISYDHHDIFYLLLATYATIWLLIPKDDRYRGTKSRVRKIADVEEWEKAKKNAALISFVNIDSSACVEYCSVHAELSVNSTGIDFFMVNIFESPHIAEDARVFFQGKPVLVLYKDGKEVRRFPVGSNKPNKGQDISSPDRAYWFRSVQAFFSL
jgi:hypothetical protein